MLKEIWNLRPEVCAAISLLALADATRCVLREHADWWFPAALAVIFALLIRKRRP